MATPRKPCQIAADVEQFQVLYGVAQPTTGSGEALRNYLTADQVTALVNGWSTVIAVQICTLAVAEPGSGQVSSNNVFNVDCEGRPVETRDGRLRRAHRAIINLRSASRSATPLAMSHPVVLPSRMRLPHSRTAQRGAALWTVVALSLLLGLLAMAQTSGVISQFKGARNERDMAIARQAAEAACAMPKPR